MKIIKNYFYFASFSNALFRVLKKRERIRRNRNYREIRKKKFMACKTQIQFFKHQCLLVSKKLRLQLIYNLL